MGDGRLFLLAWLSRGYLAFLLSSFLGRLDGSHIWKIDMLEQPSQDQELAPSLILIF
jgi:hypothetical protein